MNLILILASFLAGATLVLLFSEKTISFILSKEKESYLRELQLSRKLSFPYYIALVKLLKEHKENYKFELDNLKKQTETGEINKLNEKIDKLSCENEELSKKLISYETLIVKASKGISREHIYESNMENHIKGSQFLYFSIPESDGRFKIENRKSYNDGNSFYRIEPERNKTTGNLFYISSSLDKRAIESIDFYLIPVCDIENISDRRNAYRIELLNPGKVTLKNDCWVIVPDKKVKIKLI